MTIVIVIVVIAIAIVIVLVIKGVQKKPLVLNYCFPHISASVHRIFKILVPTKVFIAHPLVIVIVIVSNLL